MDEDGEKPRSLGKRTVIEPATIKAFIAGLLIGNLNKGLLLGFTFGALGGMFIQQNVSGVPNVAESWRDLVHRWNRTGGNNK